MRFERADYANNNGRRFETFQASKIYFPETAHARFPSLGAQTTRGRILIEPAFVVPSPARSRRYLSIHRETTMSKRPCTFPRPPPFCRAWASDCRRPSPGSCASQDDEKRDSGREGPSMVPGGGRLCSRRRTSSRLRQLQGPHPPLVAAVKASGLVKTLEGKGPFPVSRRDPRRIRQACRRHGRQPGEKPRETSPNLTKS